MHFEEKKNGEYRACLKYSLTIFVEQIYKMQRLEVSGAVRPIYGSLGVKRLIPTHAHFHWLKFIKNILKNPTCFGLRPSSGSYNVLTKVTII